MPVFAQTLPFPDAEALATKGTPYVLAICVLALAAALVWVVRAWRGDMADKRREFLAELEKMEVRWWAESKDIRKEFREALREVVEENKQSVAAFVQESKANTAAVLERLDRLDAIGR